MGCGSSSSSTVGADSFEPQQYTDTSANAHFQAKSRIVDEPPSPHERGSTGRTSKKKKSKHGKRHSHSSKWTRGVPLEAFALHALFTKYDRQRRGYLDVRALSSMLIETMWDSTQVPGSVAAEQLPSQDDIEGVMKFLDNDGNMQLERQEFVVWIAGGLNKSPESLAKFRKKGRTQELLVNFLQSIRVQRDLYLTSWQTIFPEEDLVLVAHFWDILTRAMSNANFAKLDPEALPPLQKLIHARSHADDSTVPVQALIDFLVHGYIALESMHSSQKSLHSRMNAILMEKIRVTKESLAVAAGNPFLVLAVALVFHDQDTNGDNVVDAKEFKHLMVGSNRKPAKGVDNADIEYIYELIDSNHDGLVDKEEFLSFAVPLLSTDGGQLSREQTIVQKALRPRVDAKMKLVQEQHATLVRIYRRSARSNGKCGQSEFVNLLKICHRRAPRPAPEVNENTTKAFLNDLVGGADSTNIDENTFIGQSLLYINLPPGVVEQKQNENRLGKMAMDMTGLLKVEVNYLMDGGGGGGSGARKPGETLFARERSKMNASRMFDSDSDDESSEDSSGASDSDESSDDYAKGSEARQSSSVKGFDW